MRKKHPYIAIVDDDASVVKAWMRLLRSANFETDAFSCGEDFLQSVSSHQPDCLILDVHMPGTSGFQVQDRLAGMGYAIPIVFVTARTDELPHPRPMNGGAVVFLTKPLDGQILLDAISGVKKTNGREYPSSGRAGINYLNETRRGSSWAAVAGEENGSLLTQLVLEISSMADELQKRKENEHRMESAIDELRESLIDSMELERGRIARELHDDLCQRLSLLAIGLEQLAQKENLSQDKIRSEIRLLWEDTAGIISDAGRMSRELHSCKLEQLGLVATIRGLCADLSRRHGIRVEFIADTISQEAPQDVALCLFRIAQEALRNATKYSKADVVHVELRIGPDILRLRVCDAGVGFDPASVYQKGRLGLTSMRERTRLAGGEISIRSQPSKGTEVDVRLPRHKALPLSA